MISTLRGTLLSLHPPDACVVEVAGVGFKVWVPSAVLDGAQAGHAVFLHTHLIVREDALTLFGFGSEEQRALFELLLTVQGVGPRLALAVLSALSPDVLRRAVANEQPDVFTRVRGVGKKTAEKIVFTLKDKLGAALSLAGVAAASDVDTEVIAALTTLGYSVVEAQAAVQAIPKDASAQTVEDRIRLALAYFA
ncbi:MAG: Holliday junction branch migration protein RuvA [Anaerolineales bacterium]|nr:Holliday junction branch migration protein RuvA [Anaerolineales bacterium]